MSTANDITLAVSIKTGLDNTASSEDQTAMIGWVKEGVERVQMETEVFVQMGDLVLTIGISDYRLDSSVLAIVDRQIFGADGLHYMEQTDSRTLLDLRRQGGVLACWLFALAGNDLLMIEGAPIVAETIRFSYIPKADWTISNPYTTDLSNASLGGLPSWAQKAVEYYVLWQAGERDDKASGLNPDKAMALYELEIKKIRHRILGKKGRRLSPVKIGRTSVDRRWPNGYYPRTPGVDW